MYIRCLMLKIRIIIMSIITVKARGRTGTKSLELTIPVSLVEEYNIQKGDIFSVMVDDSSNLIIKYTRVFKQRKC